MAQVAPENLEALEAWNGVLFDRFVQYRHLVVEGLGPHGDEALHRHPPAAGARVLDIGCGFGDTAQQLAQAVGPNGSVLGVDVAPRFIAVAEQEARASGLAHLRFAVADLQTTAFSETFDYAFSRFGTMFFAFPVPALRNIANALAPGGRLCLVVWRRKLDNPWLHVAEGVVDPFVEEPEETDEPTCGPGPFSMANADTVAEQLTSAGFTEIAFERCDIPYRIGADVEEAVSFNMAIGPAGEAIRLAGAQAEALRPQIEAALREALSPYQTDAGVVLGASTWIVTARVPRLS
ncbi:MAG: class I SAM-dependent methyltransferase [Solirubrobacteraceae bacterium]